MPPYCVIFQVGVCFKLIAVLLAKVSQRIQPRARAGWRTLPKGKDTGRHKKYLATNVINLPSSSQLKDQLQILGEDRPKSIDKCINKV